MQLANVTETGVVQDNSVREYPAAAPRVDLEGYVDYVDYGRRRYVANAAKLNS